MAAPWALRSGAANSARIATPVRSPAGLPGLRAHGRIASVWSGAVSGGHCPLIPPSGCPPARRGRG
eukprot:1830137-Pleurochrysis_carterae.AAC.1